MAVSRLLAALAVIALLLISFSALTSFGLVGPDEPRYASIGREMAMSGDWVTPRLWGTPWFEKPALLYWMIGGAWRLGAGDDLAPRLPGALCGVAFLGFFFWWLRREFGDFTAWSASVLLALSAMWLGFSHAATPDLPLAACYAAAMLLALPMLDGRRAPLVWAAALLGLAVLAKGLVPLVLALPLFFFARAQWRQWLNARVLLTFLAVAMPWYVLCTMRNGPIFLQVFFMEHQLGRFTSDALQHVRPWWFYVPVLLGGLLPGTLLAPMAFDRKLYVDQRLRFLLVTVIFGFVFFSLSRNKLPGYLLPLLPLVCVLIGAGMDRAVRENPRLLAMLVAASALLLPMFALIAGLLPAALADGAASVYPVPMAVAGLTAAVIPVALAAALGALLLRGQRGMLLIAALFCCGWLYVEVSIAPAMDRFASARGLWRELPEPKHAYCVGVLNRSWRYGLNYYSVTPLPDCPTGTTKNQILPAPQRPVIR